MSQVRLGLLGLPARKARLVRSARKGQPESREIRGHKDLSARQPIRPNS